MEYPLPFSFASSTPPEKSSALFLALFAFLSTLWYLKMQSVFHGYFLLGERSGWGNERPRATKNPMLSPRVRLIFTSRKRKGRGGGKKKKTLFCRCLLSSPSLNYVYFFFFSPPVLSFAAPHFSGTGFYSFPPFLLSVFLPSFFTATFFLIRHRIN